MASLVYNQFKGDVGQAKYAWQTSTVGIKATLVSGYTPAASHVYASALSGFELSGGGFSGLFSGSIRLSLVSTFVSTNQGLLVGSAGRGGDGKRPPEPLLPHQETLHDLAQRADGH